MATRAGNAGLTRLLLDDGDPAGDVVFGTRGRVDVDLTFGEEQLHTFPALRMSHRAVLALLRVTHVVEAGGGRRRAGRVVRWPLGRGGRGGGHDDQEARWVAGRVLHAHGRVEPLQ